jgi:hypothetical protein
MACCTPFNPDTTSADNPVYVYTGNDFDKSPDVQALVEVANSGFNAVIENLRNLNVGLYNDKCCEWLDWFAAGVYGFKRPTIAIGDTVKADGGWGSFGFGDHGWGYGALSSDPSFESVPDSIFIKIIQWHLYRADGYQFSIPWLRRRIQRFTGETVVGITLSSWTYTIELPNNKTTSYFKYLQAAGKLMLPEQYSYTVNLT